VLVDGKPSLTLWGVIPPPLLEPLAVSSTLLPLRDGGKVQAFKMGRSTRLGKHVVDLGTWSEGTQSYSATLHVSLPGIAPVRPRNVGPGSVASMHRVRRMLYERR